jgi:hypothetical protein
MHQTAALARQHVRRHASSAFHGWQLMSYACAVMLGSAFLQSVTTWSAAAVQEQLSSVDGLLVCMQPSHVGSGAGQYACMHVWRQMPSSISNSLGMTHPPLEIISRVLQTLEAEADKETEALAEAAKAKRRTLDGAKQQPPKQQQQQQQHKPKQLLPQPQPLVEQGNGVASPVLHAHEEHETAQAPAADGSDTSMPDAPDALAGAAVSADAATAAPAEAAAGVTPSSVPPPAASIADVAAAAAAATAAAAAAEDAAMDAAMAAAMPVDVSKLLAASRASGGGTGRRSGAAGFGLRRALIVPANYRGPDSGTGAAAGQAVGGDSVCWSMSKEQQRLAKRKRSQAAAADVDAAAAAAAMRVGDDAPGSSSAGGAAAVAAGFGAAAGQPQLAGKPLPVGSRPAWLDEVEAGSAHLNKRRCRTLQDDLSKQQQIEFMLGCDSCSFDQKVRVQHALFRLVLFLTRVVMLVLDSTGCQYICADCPQAGERSVCALTGGMTLHSASYFAESP